MGTLAGVNESVCTWPVMMTSLILHHRTYVRSLKDISHKQGRSCPDKPRPEEIPVTAAPDPLPLNSPKPFPEFTMATANTIITPDHVHTLFPVPDVDKSRLPMANRCFYHVSTLTDWPCCLDHCVDKPLSRLPGLGKENYDSE